MNVRDRNPGAYAEHAAADLEKPRSLWSGWPYMFVGLPIGFILGRVLGL